MEICDFEIPYKRSNADFHLYALGDIHAGTIHCVEDRIQAKVAEIARDKNAYWIGMGDYGEFITPRDKRFDESQKSIATWCEKDDIAETQRKWIVALFRPIRKKCIGLLYGNHEDTMRRFNHDNVHKHICDDLGVRNLGYSTWVRLFFRRENSTETHIIKCVFTHGSGCAITKGAKQNKLRRFMDDFNARIYGFAHVHDIIPDYKPYMDITAQPFGQAKIVEVEAVGAMTGSWFRTYTRGVVASYGEMKTYPPTVLGCALFTINPEKNEISVKRSK